MALFRGQSQLLSELEEEHEERLFIGPIGTGSSRFAKAGKGSRTVPCDIANSQLSCHRRSSVRTQIFCCLENSAPYRSLGAFARPGGRHSASASSCSSSLHCCWLG